jgi:hypothetical protein
MLDAEMSAPSDATVEQLELIGRRQHEKEQEVSRIQRKRKRVEDVLLDEEKKEKEGEGELGLDDTVNSGSMYDLIFLYYFLICFFFFFCCFYCLFYSIAFQLELNPLLHPCILHLN